MVTAGFLGACGGGGGEGGDTIAPSIPSNLQATALSKSQINLTWSASTDNVGVSGYEVFRGTTSLGTVTAASYSDATGLSSSTEYTYTVKAYDGANNFSGPSSLATATTGAASIRVRVIDEITDAVITGATVVLGNRTGALVTTGTTDTNGEYTFTDPPANATVTAAVSGPYVWNTSRTRYRLDTNYDVNMPEITLAVEKPSQLLSFDRVKVNISIAPGITNVVGWKYYPNGEWEHVVTDNPLYLAVMTSDVQKDGKISIILVGVDANGAPVAYGSLLDQPQTIVGTTVDIVIDKTTIDTATVDLQNVPAAALALITEMDITRSGVNKAEWSSTVSPPIPSSIVHAVPNYGDWFGSTIAVALDRNSDSAIDGAYGIMRQTKAFADQGMTVDFTASLYPPIASDTTFTDKGTARPAISWSGTDATSDQVEVEIDYGNVWDANNPNTEDYRYDLVVPPTRTSIVFPELPDELAAFRPIWTNQPGIGFGINNMDIDLAAGYNDWLTQYDQVMSGSLPMPSVMNVKISRGGIF